MIDAWLSSSLTTVTSAPPNALSTPMLAANPVGNSTADGVLERLGGGREHRHEHDDVAEGAQQHAPAHGSRAHPPSPPQVRCRRLQRDATHEAADARRDTPLVGDGPGHEVAQLLGAGL